MADIALTVLPDIDIDRLLIHFRFTMECPRCLVILEHTVMESTLM